MELLAAIDSWYSKILQPKLQPKFIAVCITQALAEIIHIWVELAF